MFSRGAVKFSDTLKIKVVLIHFHLKIIRRQNQESQLQRKSQEMKPATMDHLLGRANEVPVFTDIPWRCQIPKFTWEDPTPPDHHPAMGGSEPQAHTSSLLAPLRRVYCRSGRSRTPRQNMLTLSLLPLTFPCVVFMG